MSEPPETERRPVIDDRHGDAVEDPYRWLEADGQAVGDWVDRQNTYAKAHLDGPTRDALAPRFEPLAEVADYGTIHARGGGRGSSDHPIEGGWYFQFVERPGDDQPRLTVRSSLEGERRTLLDPNEWERRSVDWFVPSHDGALVAAVVGTGGDEQYDIRVLDVETGETVDEVPDAGRTFLAWGPEGIYYVVTGSADEGRQLEKAMRYREPGGGDRLLAEHDDPHRWPVLHADRTGAVVLAATELSAGTDLFVLDGDTFVPAITGSDAEFTVTLEAGTVYLRTDHEAPNGRVLAHPVDRLVEDDVESFAEIVPERDEPLESIAVTGDHLVVHHQHEAQSRLTRYDTDGTRLGALPLAPNRTVEELTTNPDVPECFYRVQGFDRPPGVHQVDLGTGETRRLDAPDLDVPALSVSQTRIDSTDGAEVPVFLVHREGLDLDGDNPAVLDGYGGFRNSYTPRFDRFRLPFLADGGLFAGVCARGGREFGERWHEAGMRERKQHTFDDFIAAAEFLVGAGYTAPDRLAVTGRSNGGLSVGAVLTQRPDLFGAAVCGVPLLDMLRFDEFLLGESWTPEYGSPDERDDYECLRVYSPYHNVEARAYPPVLFTTAVGDTRVHPSHARKMAARLQAEAEGGPFLLRTYADAGHGVGKPTWLALEESLEEWTFLYDQLDVESRATDARPGN